MTLATVKVLPEPVTPKSTWWGCPALIPRSSCLMARGWSPLGRKSETNLKVSTIYKSYRLFEDCLMRIFVVGGGGKGHRPLAPPPQIFYPSRGIAEGFQNSIGRVGLCRIHAES